MSTANVTPKLFRLDDAAAVYGFTRRQLRRWIDEGYLRRVKPSGVTGPVYVFAEDLDRLVEKSTIPAGKKAGRKPPREQST